MRTSAVTRWAAVVTTVVVLGVASCDEEDEEARDQARLQRLREEIVSRVGDAACQDSSQCGAIGFGKMACGGPASYLIYSTAAVDTLSLFELVRIYNEFNDYMNQKYGYVSPCVVPRYPTLGCKDGHCADVWTGP